MNSPVTVAGVTLDIEEAGQGRPLLFLHPGEGLRPAGHWIEALARNHRVIAPNHPGFGKSSLPDWFGSGRRYRLFVSGSRPPIGSARRGPGGRVLRRVDRGRNGGPRYAPPRRPGAGGAFGYQSRRRARPRHRRHALHPPRRIPPPRLGRSGERRGRFRVAAGYRTRRHRAIPRIARAVRLETLHAQSATETMAAPDRYPHATDLGRPATASCRPRTGRHGERKSPAPA